MLQRFSRLAVACAIGAACFATTTASAQDLYAPRTDWSSFTGGDLNISGFVFRDVNRNGIYDLDDPPMEGIATRMTSPQGNSLIRWTNSNGFANFSMSARDPDADVSNPGLYDFDVIVPGGWELTTGNAHQAKRFQVTPGAVADMSADPPFFPVGVAPTLTIDGTVSATGKEGGSVSVRSPSGEWHQIALQGVRQFRIPVRPGEWEVAIDYDDERQSVSRSVTVTDFPVQLSVAGNGRVVDPPGAATVIDFEDVTEKSIREMPNGVGGLMWWNMVALEVARSYNNNVVSGNYVAYNSSGHPARIWSPASFDFVGGHFGVAWQRAHGETLHVQGWRRGELIYEDSITLSYLGPVWFQADYRDIDRLDLATDRYWQFVADDLSFVVPEPVLTE
jgi:hypothetical protein